MYISNIEISKYESFLFIKYRLTCTYTYMNVTYMNGIYKSNISVGDLINLSGYVFDLRESDRTIKSLSLVISSISNCDIDYYLKSCEVVFWRYGSHIVHNQLANLLVLSRIKGRKIIRDIDQIVVPIDFWIADEIDVNVQLDDSHIMIVTPELPVNIELKVKYAHIKYTVPNERTYLTAPFYWIQDISERIFCYCPEFTVIYGDTDVDILSIQYTTPQISNTITYDCIIKKRVFGKLYNIIPITHQYSDMKDIRNNYQLDDCNKDYIIIEKIVTIPETINVNINIFFINSHRFWGACYLWEKSNRKPLIDE